MRSVRPLALLTLHCLVAAASFPSRGPDPAAVQRWGAGWRYPQAGWIVAHIEGEPYDRGLQHGHLLAPEIAAYIQALARFWGPDAPAQAWDQTRTLANLSFLRGFTPEQLQEMKGIADGASAEGARFQGRALDVIDIVTLNTANEIDTLDAALQATPTGLESLWPPSIGSPSPVFQSQRKRDRPLRCSAFAAVGPATRDGKIVFGHVTMYDLYPANFYNVWLDVTPAAGLHFAMQTTPGGMHSGMDYSINGAGILLSETTLDQARAALGGVPLASRIREAEQYADSIDRAAAILSGNGNGLGTTEWIMADIRRNEIALLTLGTNKSVLHRSSRNEWFPGTEGFYWSDNNIKDAGVRIETAGAPDGRPSPVAAYAPSKRDTVWLRMYDQNKGGIDLDTARHMITTPEIVAAWAVDVKYTNAEMAAAFQTWAAFGPPVGSVWRPTVAEHRRFPAIKPLIQNPWTVLQSVAPPLGTKDIPEDRANLLKPQTAQPWKTIDEPAWHGTLLPASDSDIWLTTAFANYERIVATEHTLLRRSGGSPTRDDREHIGVELSYYRSLYAQGARAGHDFPLAQTKSDLRDDRWYRVVTGKGVLLLATLRGIIGTQEFDRAMDEFGLTHAGKMVSTAGFETFLCAKTNKNVGAVFDFWLNSPGLPRLGIVGVKAQRSSSGWQTTVELEAQHSGPILPVPVTVEAGDTEVNKVHLLEPGRTQVVIETEAQPSRVVVDKYGVTARANGSPYTILTFDNELERVLIVYGTTDEETGNREAAAVLQHSLRRREHNVQPAIKADRDVTEDDIRTHHLLLVGRPSTNGLSARFAAHVPVRFGLQSFAIRDEVYADPGTAVIVAGENPENPRYSVVMIAGLSSLGTYQTVPLFEDDVFSYAEVVILPHGGEEDPFVAPLPELTRELE